MQKPLSESHQVNFRFKDRRVFQVFGFDSFPPARLSVEDVRDDPGALLHLFERDPNISGEIEGDDSLLYIWEYREI